MFGFLKKDRKSHWEGVYRKHRPSELGWYQESPEISLHMIEATGIAKNGRIIDVGGGASRLIELLVDRGSRVTVLDVSSAALDEAKAQLASRADEVEWIVADITRHEFAGKYDIWHDRAVFHFLTDEQDRRKYVAALNAALRVGGYLVISTFGPAAPRKCAGLKVMRYSPESLHAEMGRNFRLVDTRDETHVTPAAKKQEYIYCLFRKSD